MRTTNLILATLLGAALAASVETHAQTPVNTGTLHGTRLLNGSFFAGDYADAYWFYVPIAGTILDLRAESLNGAVIDDVIVWDPANQQIVRSFGLSLHQQTRTNLLQGWHYVLIQSLAVNTSYRLTLTGRQPLSLPDAGNDLNQATPLGEVRNASVGRLEMVGFGDNVDCYRFEIPTNNSQLSVYMMDAQEAGAAVVEVYDTAQRLLGQASVSELRATPILQITVNAGTHLLKVSSRSAARGAYGTGYRLGLISVPIPFVDTAGGTFTEARNLGTPYPASPIRVNEWVAPNVDWADFFKFTLPNTLLQNNRQTVTIRTTGTGGDITLYLYDSKPSQRGTSWNLNSNTETISASLEPGTYFVWVSPSVSAATSFTLTIETAGFADLGANDRNVCTLLGSANNLGPTISDTVGGGDVNDWYCFQMPGPNVAGQGNRGMTIAVTGFTSNVDMFVYPYNSSAPVLVGTHLGTQPETGSATLSPGLYAVQVTSTGVSTSYQLAVRAP